MSTMPAARVGDPIAHSEAGTGMLLGVLAGAAVGVVLIATTISTGGLALVAAAGMAAGAVSAGGLGGMHVGEAVMGPPCGEFATGSPNVFINGRPATFTAGSFASCRKDSGPIPLATGSASVFINTGMAGRQGEKLGCSAISIARTSPNVFIGGPSAQDPRVAIQPEVPAWAVTALQVLGVAGAIAALPYAIATVGIGATIGGAVLGMAGGIGGGMAGRALGEALGLSEAGIRSLELAGGFLGGMVAGAAGARGGQAAEARLAAMRRRPVPAAAADSAAVPAALLKDPVPDGVPMSQAEFDRIRNLPRSQRPEDPRSYLGDRYVDEHLAKFDDGASYVTPTSVLDRRGRDLVGRPDGVFVMPKREMDAVLARTGGDLGKIETELGIPPGSWNKPGATLSRIDIDDPRSLGLRMPNGREDGANPLWMPGGKLPGNGSEAVVDAIPKGGFIESIVGKAP
jgi:uncharacterized Zn-binding protein involved in type VI secretion